MSGREPWDLLGGDPWASREFDYGIGDDLALAVRQVRSRIAAQIRSAAGGSSGVSSAERQAYERAARIAECG